MAGRLTGFRGEDWRPRPDAINYYRMPHVDEMRLEEIRKQFAAGGLVSAADIERYGPAVSVREMHDWIKRTADLARREREGFVEFACMVRVRGREARADKPRKVIR